MIFFLFSMIPYQFRCLLLLFFSCFFFFAICSWTLKQTKDTFISFQFQYFNLSWFFFQIFYFHVKSALEARSRGILWILLNLNFNLFIFSFMKKSGDFVTLRYVLLKCAYRSFAPIWVGSSSFSSETTKDETNHSKCFGLLMHFFFQFRLFWIYFEFWILIVRSREAIALFEYSRVIG